LGRDSWDARSSTLSTWI